MGSGQGARSTGESFPLRSESFVEWPRMGATPDRRAGRMRRPKPGAQTNGETEFVIARFHHHDRPVTTNKIELYTGDNSNRPNVSDRETPRIASCGPRIEGN